MNDSEVSSRRATTILMVALLSASVIGVVLSLWRMAHAHNFHYALLPMNLFLAWLPLLFALGVHRLHRQGERRSLRIGLLAALWLLFLPNAPYIFTDLVHLWSSFSAFWVDLSLVLLVALTGFLVGFVSLYLMQSIVAERFGRLASWLFALVVAWLTGFGVYLGRFLRFNSWDAVVHPLSLSHSISHFVLHPLENPATFIFPTLFATFLFVGYLMLYALTHLQTATRIKV